MGHSSWGDQIVDWEANQYNCMWDHPQLIVVSGHTFEENINPHLKACIKILKFTLIFKNMVKTACILFLEIVLLQKFASQLVNCSQEACVFVTED